MYIHRLVSIIAFLSLTLAPICSCSDATGKKVDNAKSLMTEQRENRVQIVEARIINTKRKNSEWTVVKHIFPNGERPIAISVLNNIIVLVATHDGVYTSRDSANTWNKMSISLSEYEEIKAFHFADEYKGWVITQTSEFSEKYSQNDGMRIYMTQTFGRSWELVQRSDSVSFTDAAFSGENGWVVGRNFIGIKPQRFEPLVLATSGSGWLDLSEEFASFSKNATEKADRIPMLPTKILLHGNCISLLSDNKELVDTCDFGKTWKYLGDFTISNSRLAVKDFYVDEKGFWFLESVGGAGGSSTNLKMVLPAGNLGNARNIVLSDFYGDRLFRFSDGGIMISGRRSVVEKAGNSGLIEEVEGGELLLSNDNGESWEKIVETPRGHKLKSIIQVGDDFLWALDDLSIIYEITRTKRRGD